MAFSHCVSLFSSYEDASPVWVELILIKSDLSLTWSHLPRFHFQVRSYSQLWGVWTSPYFGVVEKPFNPNTLTSLTPGSHLSSCHYRLLVIFLNFHINEIIESVLFESGLVLLIMTVLSFVFSNMSVSRYRPTSNVWEKQLSSLC